MSSNKITYQKGNVTIIDKKILKIDFQNILKTNQEKDYDLNEQVGYFNLKKRAYYEISDSIANTIDYYLSDPDNPKLVMEYIKLSYYTRKDEKSRFSIKILAKIIQQEILTEKTRNKIEEFVEDNYSLNLDEESKESKNVNEELLFTDEHVKILLKCAESMRLVSPLVSQFIDMNGLDIDSNLYYVFNKIIELYEGDVNMKNKLLVFINSRISNTLYNNKVIWRKHSDNSVSPDLVADEFLSGILVGILPKGQFDNNLINYLHVTVRNKIRYAFSSNFVRVNTPLNMNQVDSEGLTSFDKFEINLNKIDESKSIINSLSIKSQTKNILNEMNYTMSEAYFKYYKETISLNHLQQKLIFLYFSKYCGGFENLYNSDRDEYIIMVLILKKKLEDSGFTMLPKFLTAIQVDNQKKISINRTKMIERIESSKKYNNLINNKYKFSKNTIEDEIIKLVTNITNKTFVELPDFYDVQDIDFEKEIEINTDILSDEILSFLELI